MSSLIKYCILAVLLFLCLALVYYSHFILKTEVVYSHFFYLPIVCAGFWWGMRGIGVAIFLAGLLVIMHYFSGTNIRSIAPNIFILRACIIVVVGVVVGVLRDKSLQAEKRIRDFSRKILSLREEEKKRIAIDLHDDLGAMVVSVTSKLDIARDDIKNSDVVSALAGIDQASDALKKSVADIKRIAVDLRPPDLDILDLDEILDQYCNMISFRSGLKLELSFELPEGKLSEDVTVVIYRIVQEALTNIVKHSKASTAWIKIAAEDANVELSIIDNGEGFDVGSVAGSGQETRIGIEGMRQRAESLGGSFSIRSEKKKGCHIKVIMPLVYT